MSARLAPPVGGFFELQAPGRPRRSLFRYWRLDARRDLFLGNARSALARLLRVRAAKRVWLPAYVCEAVCEAAAAAGAQIAFYPLDERLEPDVPRLAAGLRRGDYVLAVDYFGAPPGRRFRRLVASRRDVRWIEDRAQALHTGAPPWGHWELFSPRKLLGVPDGGILAARRGGRTPAPRRRAAPDIGDMLMAQAARLADPAGYEPGGGFARFRAAEAAQCAGEAPLSDWTWAMLHAVDPAPLARRRARNYRRLGQALGDLAFRAPGGPAPFGFPIRVPDAARLAEALHRRGVFAQRHWPRLPSPARRFPEAHRLARQLLTLPCDHRYSDAQMRAVARAVRQCL